MKTMKHIGKLSSTGERVVVVFRSIYDDQGAVIDPNHCLVVKSDALPDHIHDQMMQVVTSNTAQETINLYEVLTRNRTSDGVVFLQWLHANNRLHKVATNLVTLTPNNTDTVLLSVVNYINYAKSKGVDDATIQKNIDTGNTEIPNTSTTPISSDAVNTNEQVLSDRDLAQNMMAQAMAFKKQSEDLIAQAAELCPDLFNNDDETTESNQ